MNSPQAVISGYPSFDRIMRVNQLPSPGETGVILDPPGIPLATPGGCASNIAVSMARLGVSSALSTLIGDDEDGLRFRDLLLAEGVETSCVLLRPGGKTASTFLFADRNGDHQTFYYPGCADDAIPLPLLGGVLGRAKYGVVTVGNPFHTQLFVQSMMAAGVPLVWSLRNDPHAFPPTLVEALIRSCRIVIMNHHESEALLRTLSLRDLRGLGQFGVEVAVETLGDRGCHVYGEEGDFSVPAVKPVRIADPTGAGDAFAGGLLSGLCLGFSIETAARMGAVVASFVLEQWGCQAGLPRWQAMEERYRLTFGRELLG